MDLMNKTTFVCVDCESTGLDWDADDIIEVAVVTFTLEKKIDIYESLVNPGRGIPEESIKIHNITQDMVKSKPRIQEILPAVIKLIGKYPIVGHGVGFDIHLIQREAKKHNIACTIKNNPVLDTLRMARLYGESPKNSLENLRIHFNIDEEGAHRALNDVIVNIEVFKQLSKRYKTVSELLKRLEKPIRLRAMPLGKHKGRPFNEIPEAYLGWAAHQDFDKDLLYSIRSELKNRNKVQNFSKGSNPFGNL